jgi:hypothetical protein
MPTETDWKTNYQLAAADRRELNDKMANVSRYDGELNRLEIAPNGDDYNAVIAMLRGAPYRAPRTGGR